MILDSTFIIDFLRGSKDARIFGEKLVNEMLRTTTITVFETFAGAKEKEFTTINDLFGKLPVLPLTTEDAQKGGIILKKLREQGQDIDPQDAMIAGIALRRNEPLVTRNRKHFEKIPGLHVITY